MRGLFLLLLLTNIALLTWQYVLRDMGQEASINDSAVPRVNEGLTLISELPAEQEPALRETADDEVWAKPWKEESPRETILPKNTRTVSSQNILGEGNSKAKDEQMAICLSVEDIESESALQRLQQMLTKSGAKLIEKGEKEGTKANYWVMLPPYPNRRKADEAAAILSAKKIKDFFIVRSGEYENAVSLGVFSEHERANLRFKQIVALKVRLRRPRIETIDLPAKGYFITFKVGDPTTHNRLVSRLESLEFPPVKKVICR